MSKPTYQIDFYPTGQALRSEIEFALGPSSNTMVRDIARLLFPDGVPDIVDCIQVALETFEAVFNSRLQYHETYRNAWPGIDLALENIAHIDRLTTAIAPSIVSEGVDEVDQPSPAIVARDMWSLFQDEALLHCFIEPINSMVDGLLAGKTWHRFELLRSNDVQRRRNAPVRLSALTIRDLGDHRILHYHETMDREKAVQRIDQPIRLSATSGRMVERDFALSRTAHTESEDPADVNRYILVNLFPNAHVRHSQSDGHTTVRRRSGRLR